MRSSLFVVSGLCTLAFATPDHVVKRHEQSLSSVLAKISSLSSELQPPASIASELTGIPASVTSILYNPSAVSSLAAQIAASGLPAWFTSLPADAQVYVLGLGPKVQSIVPQIISLEVAAGLTTLPGAAGTGVGTGGMATATIVKTSGVSNSTVTTPKLTSTSMIPAGTTVITTKASGTSAAAVATSKSSSAGAAQTNAVAAGIVGAVGFLGLAFAL